MKNSSKIPSFNQNGLLPDGIYSCDEDLLYARFVNEFKKSGTRRKIFNGFSDWRARVGRIISAAIQWVDGSFVTNKLDPRDIDVVTFCDYDYLSSMDPQQLQAIKDLLNADEGTKPLYWTHTFLVPSCDPQHPFYPAFEKARKYWRKQWGRARAEHNPSVRKERTHLKGFVEMVVGNRKEAPVISHKRGRK